ncbi:MAG: hypothetical protein R2788_26675 [Saprospiraceae bacterium]
MNIEPSSCFQSFSSDPNLLSNRITIFLQNSQSGEHYLNIPKKGLLLLVILLLFSVFSIGQIQPLPPVTLDKKEVVLRRTNVNALREWARKDSIIYYEERERAEEIARSMGLPIKGKYKDGRAFELQGFDESGQLKYYETTNRGGAATISTDEVWPGGDAGTSLTGQGWSTCRMGWR